MSCACLQSHCFFFFLKPCLCEDNNPVKQTILWLFHPRLLHCFNKVLSNHQNWILFVKLWVKANWLKSVLKPNLSLFAPFAFFCALPPGRQSSADSAQLLFLASWMLTQVFVLKQIATLPPLSSLSLFLPLCLHFLLFLTCSLFAVILLWLLWVPNWLGMGVCVCACACLQVWWTWRNKLVISCCGQSVWICVGATRWLHSITMAEMSFHTQDNMQVVL